MSKDRQRFFSSSILVGAAVLLLLGLSSIAIRWGIADVYAFQARSYYDAWKKSNTASEENWNKAYEALSNAMALGSGHPEYMDSMGRLYALKVPRKAVSIEKAGDDFNHAINYYRRAIEARPAWPRSWANLAFLKMRVNKVDAELNQAIIRAVHLGPWERRVQRRITEAGLFFWEDLEPSAQASVMKNIKQGLVTRPCMIAGLTDEYHKLDIVLDKFPTSRKTINNCIK